ncbi:hypothetical protein Tco_0486491 [Tanacetum coccineum]
MMTDKYCSRGEIKKLEIEMWNLKVKESDEVEKYVGGLPDMIQRSVMASKPKKMQDAIEFATELMDQKICTLAERQAENKRKFEDTSRNNQNQQHPFKRHNVARAYTVGPRERNRTKDLNLCALFVTTTMMGSVLPSAPITRKLAIWPGHFKSNCPKLKNKNQGNQVGNGNVVGTTGTNSNSNVVTGTFLLKNHYASILFNTGVDRSFVSTAFSSLIDIIPTTLDHGYDIGSFDVIIGMDWLSKYHVVIVRNKKSVCIPFGDEILIVCGDGSNNKHMSRLNIISWTKTQKYLLKGCHIFLAHVTVKKAEDKSEEKQLEDVPIV